jgi:hypothetical protein
MSTAEHVRARLDTPGAVLSRTDLSELGWPRRGVDAVFRGCPNIYLPGYSRPVVLVRDYLSFVEEHTYDPNRVR